MAGPNPIYLSYLITKDTPRYGDKGVVDISRTREISKGHTSNNSELHFATHLGTHIDAPFHFYEQGKTIDDYPPEFWSCKHPYLIHYSAIPEEIIGVDAILKQLTDMPDECDCVFISTNFSRFRNDDKQMYIFHNPGLSPEVGTWLRKNTSIKMIGFDFISLSSYAHRDLGREAHRAFLSELEIDGDNMDPILIIEDMDLSKLKICPEKIVVSPLRFEKADGAPVTVFGFYE